MLFQLMDKHADKASATTLLLYFKINIYDTLIGALVYYKSLRIPHKLDIPSFGAFYHRFVVCAS